jgi:hypothetical protein
MREVVRFAFWLVAGVVRRRAELVAENALLGQQLIAAQRKIRGRVHWTPWERFIMGLAARLAPAWRTPSPPAYGPTCSILPETTSATHCARVGCPGAASAS